MFTLDNPYGHQTSDGKDAKYLGPYATGNHYHTFLIDGAVYCVEIKSLHILYTSDIGYITDKTPPEKWYPVVKYPIGGYSLVQHEHPSKEQALKFNPYTVSAALIP